MIPASYNELNINLLATEASYADRFILYYKFFFFLIHQWNHLSLYPFFLKVLKVLQIGIYNLYGNMQMI